MTVPCALTCFLPILPGPSPHPSAGSDVCTHIPVQLQYWEFLWLFSYIEAHICWVFIDSYFWFCSFRFGKQDFSVACVKQGEKHPSFCLHTSIFSVAALPNSGLEIFCPWFKELWLYLRALTVTLFLLFYSLSVNMTLFFLFASKCFRALNTPRVLKSQRVHVITFVHCPCGSAQNSMLWFLWFGIAIESFCVVYMTSNFFLLSNSCFYFRIFLQLPIILNSVFRSEKDSFSIDNFRFLTYRFSVIWKGHPLDLYAVGVLQHTWSCFL